MKIINNLPVKTEVQEQMGNLYQLQTSVKNNLVDAINWFYVTIMDKIGTSDISNTGDGTVTGAIRALGDVAGTLGTAASGEIANNDTTDESGYVADARIVKVHGDEIDALKEENTLLKRTLENAFQWKMVPVSLDMEGVPAWGHRSTVIKEAINACAVGIWDSTGNNWTFIHNTGTGGATGCIIQMDLAQTMLICWPWASGFVLLTGFWIYARCVKSGLIIRCIQNVCIYRQSASDETGEAVKASFLSIFKRNLIEF